MANFEYIAFNKNGKKIKGVINEENQKQAEIVLKKQNLFIIEIIKSDDKEIVKNKHISSFFSQNIIHKTIKSHDLMLITRQLSALLNSGLQINAAFKLIVKQADKKTVKKIILELNTKLKEGFSLSNALESCSYKFPNDYIATIRAGEESGHITEVMEQLADDVEHKQKTSQSLVSALIYPLVMIGVSLAVVVSLMVYVVPQIVSVFDNSKQKLPQITIILMSLSDFLVNYGRYLLIFFILSILAFIYYYNKSYKFKYKIHSGILKIPMIKSLIIAAEFSRYSRSLGILLRNGVPSIQAFVIASQLINNVYLIETLNKINLKIREGQNISSSLSSYDIIPDFIIHMAGSGEVSGNLDELMLKVSDYYDHYLKITTQTLLKVFEPLLVVFMGGIVLIIVLAVLLPIFQLNQLI